MLRTITFCCSICLAATAFAQRGKDNSYTVTAANTQLNSYTALTANAAVNATSITVASNALTNSFFASSLTAGDLIMVIQMQGATMDVDVTPTASWGGHYTVPNGHQGDWTSYLDLWGNVTAYNNAGKYEMVEVRSVTGSTTINLMCGLKNSYTASGHVQVIRVPRLVDLTLNASATVVPALWDGTVGGVVALEVNGNVTFNAGSKISATGYGFRGGVCENFSNGSPPGGGATSVGFCASDAATEGAEKGEGIGGFYTEYDALYSRYCKSAPANGGGGGGNHNSGGGGGANIGTGAYTGKGIPVSGYTASWNLESAGFATSSSSGGGRGGYSYSTVNQDETTVGPANTLWAGDYRRSEGGLGGHALTYDATRVFMGGGGGAGDQNSSQGGGGGRGGGIVMMTVYGSFSGTGTIESNGANGLNSNPAGLVATAFSSTKYGNDGAGGAGGGGSVAISNGTAIPATVTLSARGGNGGNQAISYGNFVSNPTMEGDGPGGGGAGGMISFTSGTPTQSVIGGNNGTTNSTHLTSFPPNGATMGASGTGSLTQPFYNITAPNVTICPNTSTTLTATVTGTGGTLSWYATPFGTAVLGTGTTYNTPVLSSSTTYYVGTCPGTFRLPVTVTVSGAPTISGTLTVPVGGTTSLTGSPTANAVTPWASSNTPVATISSAGLVTGVSPGTTTITYMNSSGCFVTATVIVTVPLPVELVSFTAELNGARKADLTWITDSETNNDRFIVERSTDLENWEELLTVAGQGKTTVTTTYSEQDGNPFFGVNYYRLSQVDYDGTLRLLSIDAVYLSSGNGEIVVYPNPASDALHMISNRLDTKQVTAFNSLGQAVEVQLTLLSDDHAVIDVSMLAPGIYYFRVADVSGTTVHKIEVSRR